MAFDSLSEEPHQPGLSFSSQVRPSPSESNVLNVESGTTKKKSKSNVANMRKRNYASMSSTERVSLPERVAHAYYSHGLVCSSHPILILCFTISIILLCSYPLINLPLPGIVPIQTVTEGINSEIPDNITIFSGKPYIYIQQIVLKTGVSPWLKNSMTVHDAFRAPLHQVFSLLETIRNFQINNSSSSISISNLCLHVESVKLKYSEDRKKLLPEYNCLILSPANFWQQNENNFQMDDHLIGTIFNYHNIQKGKISLTEILFGINIKESGLKRHPMRSRPRTLKYAITLVLERFEESYITGLRKKLETQYPLHITANDFLNGSKTKQSQETLHIYYPGEFKIHELFPLVGVYVILFLYIYFSLRKIEPVKSKIGIAFSAVVTVISCLCMSLGMCFFFGLNVSLNGKEIFPYLVAIVGLENVLVITESITNTPSHLDVKIRVAQGLSREGWSITKNFLIQVTILTIGFATFVISIQELCILGIVGLVCDFFLQLCFFTTILSIDIHRSETNFDNKNSYYYQSIPTQKILSNSRLIDSSNLGSFLRYYGKENKDLMRSKSHHNLTSCFVSTSTQSSATYPANVLAHSTLILNKIPKRLKLVHIWASTRFFQRIFMITMIGWMCFILYNKGFIQQIFQIDEIAKFHEKLNDLDSAPAAQSAVVFADESDLKSLSSMLAEEASGHIKQEGDHFEGEEGTEDMSRFRYREQDPHRRLSLYHWPVLMSLYNISLTGKYITVLPAIRISHVVSPNTALSMHNPNEKTEHFQWKTLAVALDPLDFSSPDDGSKISSILTGSIDRPFIPRSPMEIAFACILVIVSVFVLSYMTMVLYRCICSRNYAEWRSSWESHSQQESDTQVVLEAVPTPLEGHVHEIECIATDGCTIVSSCLGGQIRVWNSTDGDIINQIDREKYFSSLQISESGMLDSDFNHSDYESGSPPSRGEFEMSNFAVRNHQGKMSTGLNSFGAASHLQERVLNNKLFKGEMQLKPDINFSDLKLVNLGSNQSDSKKGFDFGSQYKFLIDERRGSVDESEAGGRQSSSSVSFPLNQSFDNNNDFEKNHKRCSLPINCENWNGLSGSVYANGFFGNSDPNISKSGIPPIWCLDCLDNLIVIGCSNGRMEFWESLTAQLKCTFEDGNNTGVTAVKVIGDKDKVIAARLNGSLDFFQIESHIRSKQSDWGFTSARRTHVRTGSAGSALDWEKLPYEFRCRKLGTVKAHQQPITVLDCENGRVVTGSQDHTLKVLRLEDHSLLYTLHGHCGPITCMFIDRMTPFLSGSGSQDGLLCVWDLLNGACIYSIQAHDGSVSAVTYSASYVISLGTDERLCVWERFLGHLLNTIHVMHAYCSSMVMLTHNLLVMSRHGSLVLWDVRCGDPVRIVRLGDSDHSVFVTQILTLGDSVVCDYGNQLRIVKFPIVSDKTE